MRRHRCFFERRRAPEPKPCTRAPAWALPCLYIIPAAPRRPPCPCGAAGSTSASPHGGSAAPLVLGSGKRSLPSRRCSDGRGRRRPRAIRVTTTIFPHGFLLPVIIFLLESRVPRTIRCVHYRRKCKIRAPCCGEVFDCRHCHNEAKVRTSVFAEFCMFRPGSCGIQA